MGVRDLRRSPAVLRRLALASVVANLVIVVTGGTVRLTNSGLGCPTWPRCDRHSLTPTQQNAAHGLIEFSNRTLTFALAVVAVATLVVAISQRRGTKLAVAALVVIPAQAVIGGISVLTDLNPWIVACHFLVSMVNIAITTALWRAVSAPRGEPVAPAVRGYALGVTALTAAVLVVGTVVTGSGPHAGDLHNGKVRRTGLDPGAVAHLHADLVMVLVGLTAGLLLAAWLLDRPALRRAAAVLLAAELAQGVVGFVQYFTHLPVVLVALHLLGACLVWVAALDLLLSTSEQLGHRVDHQADQRADDGAVHPDELQVPADL
jgi:heme a synthase